jgi:hypothetical protein
MVSTILGVRASISAQKIWKRGRDLWIAAAGILRNLPLPPGVWPSPPDDGPQTFRESVQAVAAQMAGGEYTTSPLYALACIRASSDGLERARVSNGGVEFGPVGTVFRGGAGQNLRPPDSIPNDPGRCGDLVIALGSQTLRTPGYEKNSLGGPSIAWPLYLYQWRQGGTMIGARISETEGLLAEWRDLGNRQMDTTAPIHRAEYLAVMEECAAKGWRPEDLAFSVRLKIEGNPRPTPTDLATEPPTTALPV